MLVIPAIDLSEGQVVRLRRGDMAQRTVYSSDPVAVARRWADAGAQIIHVVDLDGAVSGRPRNLAILERIASAVDAQIEFGGGLRTMEAIRQALDAGASWAILGTAALSDRGLLSAALAEFADRVIVAIDARDGRVAVEGWTKTTDVDAADLAREMERFGVRRLLCTDIATDGMLSGPNISGLRRIAEAVSIPIIASGGVSSIVDILALRQIEQLGIIGVVVGRALYENRLDLAQAISAARGDGR